MSWITLWVQFKEWYKVHHLSIPEISPTWTCISVMHITTKDEFNTNTHYLEPAPVKRIPELPCGVPVSYPCRTRVPVATRGEAKKTKVRTRIPASYPCRTRGYPRRSEKKPKSVPVYPWLPVVKRKKPKSVPVYPRPTRVVPVATRGGVKKKRSQYPCTRAVSVATRLGTNLLHGYRIVPVLYPRFPVRIRFTGAGSIYYLSVI
jgi:hypothetical protein